MLDDFCSSAAMRRRFGGSMSAVLLVYGVVGAAMAAAAGPVRPIVEDELTLIELVTELPPEPPPPTIDVPPPVEQAAAPTPAPAAPRPKVKQPEPAPPPEAPLEEVAQPDAPLEEVAQPDAPLVQAAPVGSADGLIGGAIGGTGTAPAPPGPAPAATAALPPPPRPEPLVPPVEQAGNAHPRYSLLAKRNGIEGLVVVSFEVLEDGRVSSVRIISGPEELHESVLKAVNAWRFQPARRGQVTVRHKVTKQIRFRLEDA